MGDQSTTAAEAAERDSNNIIEQQLDGRIKAVEAGADADALGYIGPMFSPADDEIKDAIEEISPRRDALIVLLETGGGYVHVTERIARIFRHHYDRVEFVVPNYAMSAGTVLVMSGDAIHMDYASVLGPIDPQVMRNGMGVPALGYLEQYQRLVKKSADGTLTSVEAMYLVQNFDAAELYLYEQERELSIALLKEWLRKYKFKDWTKTKTRGKTVTPQMRTDRARTIATALNKTDRWHSHNRGISMEVLDRDLKLLIEDSGSNPDLAQPIHDYYRLLKDYVMRRDQQEGMIIHTRGRYAGYR